MLLVGHGLFERDGRGDRLLILPDQILAVLRVAGLQGRTEIDVIGDLFAKYYNLLTASSYAFLVPVIQHNWLAAFEVPWMPEGYTFPRD